MGTHGAGIVMDAGEEDPEHPAGRGGGPKTQRALMGVIDRGHWEALKEKVSTDEADRGYKYKRVNELANPQVDKAWLWGASQVHGAAIADQEEYQEAVRLMLGTGGPKQPTKCKKCGECTLDTAGVHASKCATGEATRRHNKVAKVLMGFASTVDPEAEMEPTELVASAPHVRPADVLTAAPGRLTAWDVGVTSSDTGTTGEKAAQNMHDRKVCERVPIAQELQAQGIEYVPLTFSNFGTMHAKAEEEIKKLARNVGRNRGWTPRAVERQIRTRIAACIWRGNARMSLSTWGGEQLDLEELDQELAGGESDSDAEPEEDGDFPT